MKRKATIMDFWANNGNNKRPTNTEESSTGSTIEAVLPCSSISNVTTETSNFEPVVTNISDCVSPPVELPSSVNTQLMSEPASTSNHSSTSSTSLVLDIAQGKSHCPTQPVIQFPKSMFGSVGRSFQHRWYSMFSWLEYSISRDSAYCFACRHFQTNPDPTFTFTGFRWYHRAQVCHLPCSVQEGVWYHCSSFRSASGKIYRPW